MLPVIFNMKKNNALSILGCALKALLLPFLKRNEDGRKLHKQSSLYSLKMTKCT